MLFIQLLSVVTLLFIAKSAKSTAPSPCQFNGQCLCSVNEEKFTLNVICNSATTFPSFDSFDANNMDVFIIVNGSFSNIPSYRINGFHGIRTSLTLMIIGSSMYPYEQVSIDPKAFVSQYNVLVEFQHYYFPSLPTDSITVPNILVVMFSECKIPEVGDNSFNGYKGSEIYLWSSEIETLESNAFKGTSQLNNVFIEGNRFTDISSFKMLQTYRLDLTEGNISSIADYSFSECNMDGCPNTLQNLDFTNNPVSFISDKAFANLPDLQILILYQCKLTTVPISAINSLTNLTTLNINSNQITVLKENSFSNLQKLTELTFAYNPIATIEPGAFNGLTGPSISIYGLPDLRSVDISITKGINNVQYVAFSNCQNLNEIFLSDIDNVPISLTLVNASQLRLSTVNSSIEPWFKASNMNVLDLSNNQLFICTCDIYWMAKYVLSSPPQIITANALCLNKLATSIYDYLQSLQPDCTILLPTPRPSSATTIRSRPFTSLVFILCLVLLKKLIYDNIYFVK